MRITKFLLPLSLIYNFVTGLIIYNYFVSGFSTQESNVQPKKFPVVLIQRNETRLEALNLSSSAINLDGMVIPPASITNGIVTPYLLPRLPSPQESFKFPSEYAKVSPEIFPINEVPNCKFCIKNEKQWIIPSGVHKVSDMLVIPENLKLIFEAGAILHFNQHGGLFSRSPVEIRGEKKSPVVLTGDHWRGMTILSPGGISRISYLEASGGKGFEFIGMKYTGMLNFITGQYEVDHLTISHSQAEDGVNFKWAKGNIQNLTISDSLSDAIDIDWSDIKVTNADINGAGNDCMDFSGGKIIAEKISLFKCKDKAISNGEENQLMIDALVVGESKIGIANKDGASIEVDNFEISEAEIILHQYLGKHFYPEPSANFHQAPVTKKSGKYLITSGKVSSNATL